MDNRPVGFLDSGLGGLTVVREFLEQLPNENIVYIGDSLRAPYGVRPSSEIRDFTWQLVNFLLSKNVKAIVMACNTATAVTLNEIKSKLSIPVIGVIRPGARAVAQKFSDQKIALIATEATVKSRAYTQALKEEGYEAEFISLACPEFVTLAESGITGSEAEAVVRKVLSPLIGQIDLLILGCTHFPLLKSVIAEVMGSGVVLVDSGQEAINDIRLILESHQLTNIGQGQISADYYTTGSADRFSQLASQWLGRKVEAQTIELDSRPTLLIATRNSGKVSEFTQLFQDYQVKSLLDFPDLPDIEETGKTFEENARLKAETISQLTGELVIADDSGLCVDALEGKPGLYSHRYAGENPSDAENREKLLSDLVKVTEAADRVAHFHTTLVAARPHHDSLVVEADWPGQISKNERGTNGFGYDSLFLVAEKNYQLTAAELSADEKNHLSHRAKALQKLLVKLPEWLKEAPADD